MPYVDKAARQEIDAGLRAPITGGELSYVITRDVRRWVGPHPDFVVLATATGILLLTLLEFVRRVVFPYEDRKAQANGDVYGE